MYGIEMKPEMFWQMSAVCALVFSASYYVSESLGMLKRMGLSALLTCIPIGFWALSFYAHFQVKMPPVVTLAALIGVILVINYVPDSGIFKAVRLATMALTLLFVSGVFHESGGWLSLYFGCMASIMVLEYMNKENMASFTGKENLESLSYDYLRALLGPILLFSYSNPFPVNLGIGSWPYVVQAVLACVVLDFKTYWHHRLQHGWLPLWKFHRAHHSTKELSAISGTRSNVVDVYLFQAAVDVSIVWMLGLTPSAVVFYWLLDFALAGSLCHSGLNIPKKETWFCKVLNTPNVHTLHHELLYQGGHMKTYNFADVFPIWDVMFGTYKYPEKPVTEFGIDDTMYNNSNLIIQQVVLPFVPYRYQINTPSAPAKAADKKAS